MGTYPLQAIIDNLNNKEEKKIVLDFLGDKVTEMSLVIFMITYYLFLNFFLFIKMILSKLNRIRKLLMLLRKY